MPRLDATTLPRLPSQVQRPLYDRAALSTGIVHLGIGAFHRAHQAVYTEAVLEAGDPRWGICGASLRSPATQDALAPQDCLYTLVERGEAERLQVVGAVRETLVAGSSADTLFSRLREPGVRIVSLTVTEKGYHCRPGTDELDEHDPSILADLAAPARPKTTLGILAEAIRLRRADGTRPFTVLSCDNLSHNGSVLRSVLTRFATRLDPELGAYVENEIAFPSTMVDRIVPATTDEDRARVEAALGVADAWPVVAEPFSQWVIEDRFPAGRPEWERAGATFASDVVPFEAMKLRLLNGSHSALAYLGLLAGFETVDEAIADPALAAFIASLMEDASETLHLPAGTDLAAYRAALLARFANPALKHRLSQIASDGSQKLPPRILAVIGERLAAGRPIANHARVVAAWLRFVETEGAARRSLNDPLSDELLRAVRGARGEVPDLPAVFGDLSADPRFRAVLAEALRTLRGEEAHSR